jgi:GWxTD domain-containing protein
MSPFLLALAVMAATEGRDDLGVTLKHATFLASDSTLRIELSYEIPYTALAFQRDDSGFLARFALALQCWNDRKVLVCAQDWNEQVHEVRYEGTMNSSARVAGTKSVVVPRTKLAAEVTLCDFQSERSQRWQLRFEPPLFLSDLRLHRQTARGPKSGDSEDSLEVSLEVYPGFKGTDRIVPESVFLVVSKERRIWASARQPVRMGTPPVFGAKTGSVPSALLRFKFSLSGYETGRYDVIADAFGPSGRALEQRRGEFTVEKSFFLSERDYQERVEKLVWIATQSEMAQLRRAAPAQRESLWNAFWHLKDQTPTTEENETERDYFERIEYAIKHFSHGDKGYRSDRGRVYVKLGPPDNIESMPFESDSHGYEKWYYYAQNLELTFYDVNGFGEYKLIDPKDFFR